MPDRLRLVLCAVSMVFVLYSCQQPKTPADSHPATNRLPSATELFDLRSKCAAFGEKILEENIIERVLTQEQVSRYNPETNRCYVKLSVSTADLSTPQENFVRDEYLYDGQTKELLASAYWKGNTKSAVILSDSLKKFVHDSVLPTYAETDDLIDKFVAEDRKP